MKVMNFFFCLNELEKRFDYGKIWISCEETETERYSRKRLSLILIEESKPFVIQGFQISNFKFQVFKLVFELFAIEF